MSERVISFSQACAIYGLRYTMKHMPAWAKEPMREGVYHAPQYASDNEWDVSTIFPGERGLSKRSKWCNSNQQTFPLSRFLKAPYVKGGTNEAWGEDVPLGATQRAIRDANTFKGE